MVDASNEPSKPSAGPTEEDSPKLVALPSDLAPDVDVSALVSRKANAVAATVPKPATWNHLTGRMEVEFANPARFEEQFNLFNNTGKALDTSGKEIVSYYNVEQVPQGTSIKKFKKELRMKRIKVGDPSQGDYVGPWATYKDEKVDEADEEAQLTEEQKTMLKKLEEKRQKKVEEQKEEVKKPIMVQAKSVFHANLAKDYQSRSFMEPPADQKTGPHQCFIPKKCLHTWVGHTKGVQCVRIFPKYGHFILSGSFDTQIKLWDVMTNRKCIQTYMGHTEAVRDLCFSNDGKTFLSASFDKNVLLWDTEYGKVIRAFTNRKTPFCVKFHPDDSKQNLFMVGSQAKKVYAFDKPTNLDFAIRHQQR